MRGRMGGMLDNIDQLAADYQSNERADARGPRFVQLAYAIDQLMQSDVVCRDQLVKWLGPPDLFEGTNQRGTLLYRFDHNEAGRNRDEWYFLLEDGRLVQSGFNHVGINDLTGLRPGAELDG
jgi:hypothetical protein